MKLWTRLLIPAAVFGLAIAAAVTVQAVGDDGSGSERGAAAQGGAGGASPMSTGGNAVAGMCAPGVTDCVDTVVYPDGEAGEETMPADCPPDTACIEPWLMDPPVCPAGVSPEECRMAVDPGQSRCALIEPTIDPMPPSSGDDVPANEPPNANGGADEVTTLPAEVDGSEGEVTILPVEEDAGEGSMPSVDCEPVPPPIPCEDPAATCLAPDCAISSDGAVVCAEPEGTGSGETGQSEPGSPPSTGAGVDAVPGSAGTEE